MNNHSLKYIMSLVLAFTMTFAISGCGGSTSSAEPESTESLLGEGDPVPTQSKEVLGAQVDPASVKIGLLMGIEDGELSYAAIHGFLRSAENLGYPAKLYTAPTSKEAAQLVDKAIADGCKGLIVWVDSPEMESALQKANQAGIWTVVPFETVDEGQADSNLYQDETDYTKEAARILVERIRSRNKSNGTIFVAGASEHPEISAAFKNAISETYPEYNVVEYTAASNYEDVYKLIMKTPDIVALLALENKSAEVWNDAANNVQADGLKLLEPTPTPAPSGEPAKPQKTPKKKEKVEATPTPKPTVDPELEAKKEAAKRYVNILLLDYTRANIRLVDRGVVTGLIARPFFDSTAQSVYMLDKLFRGIPTQVDIRLNVPIIRKPNLLKYDGVMQEVYEWFNLSAESFASEPSAAPTNAPENQSSAPSDNGAEAIEETATIEAQQSGAPSGESNLDPLPSSTPKGE